MKNKIVRKNPPVIRTPDQRLRVFVSSTLKEMAAERKAAREAINHLRLSPVMFEMGARPHLAGDLYRAYLDQSHIFIGIYGEEYGWIAPESKISGLEEEYSLAGEKPKLIYIKKPIQNRDGRLQEMLWRIRDNEGISYKYFSTAEELRELILNDLVLLLTERFESTIQNPENIEQAENRPKLPIPPNPIVGREQEIETANHFLLQKGVRLLTLTGPGGSGKTRLGLEIASQLHNQFDQIYFVELAALNDSDLVAANITQSLGIREAGSKSPEDLLIDFLTNRNILLILDNFEQIIPAAVLIARLLENCRWLKLLVTSRVTLHLRGERELAVLPLSVPDKNQDLEQTGWSNFASIQLFLQRVKAIKPEFTLDEKSIPIIAEICRRLDGLPLAIELAAARSRLLTPKAILSRLNKCLPVLTSGASDVPERQKTMRNTIAWSYDLLENEAAVVFYRLSVFTGGFTLEAADAVANFDQFLKPDILEVLEELVDKNLVRSRFVQKEDDLRFEMLETIREYALEKLMESGAQSDLERIHAEYFARLGEEAEPFYRSAEREIWLDRVETELDNLRAVFNRSLSDRIPSESAVRLVGTLGWFCHLRGHLSEGRRWAESVLNLPFVSNRSVLRGKVLFPAGGLAWSQSDYRTSVRYLEEAAAIFREYDDKRWQVQAQVLLAGGMASLGDYDQAFSLADEAVKLSREVKDSWGEAYSLYWLGDILILKSDDFSGAKGMYEESWELFQELNDSWGVAETKGHIGVVDNLQRQFKTAKDNFQESLDYMKIIGDKWAVARGLSGLGDTHYQIGELESAKVYYKESLYYWDELGNISGIKMCLAGIARISAQEKQFDKAVILYGAAPDPVRIVGILLVHTDNSDYQKLFITLKSHLDEQEWQQAYQKGKFMSLKKAMDFAKQT